MRQPDHSVLATAGPDTLEPHTSVPTHGENMTTVAQFSVSAGERNPFVLNYHSSQDPSPPPIDAEQALEAAERGWREWSGRSTYQGRWGNAVLRSLLTLKLKLKALTYGPSGGIIAAPTTSLPEQSGGVRNWDYRFCWLRDATFTFNALLLAGYRDEAPVRAGNAASTQFQLDVYGEVMDTLHLDASLISLVGFLPGDDPRVRGTARLLSIPVPASPVASKAGDRPAAAAKTP